MRNGQEINPSDLVVHPAAAPRVGDAVLQLVDEMGYDPADFVVQHEPHSALARDLGLLGGLLRVQCRSTNEDRLYSTGRGSTWMASVLGDFDDGHFSRALRRGTSTAGAKSRTSDALREQQQQQLGYDDFVDTAPDVRLPSSSQEGATPGWGEVTAFRPRTRAMQVGFGGF